MVQSNRASAEVMIDALEGTSESEVAPTWLLIGINALLALTVIFNPLLAIINAQAVELTGAIVAAFQAALVGGALLIGVLWRKQLPLPWILLSGILIAANVLLGLLRDEFNPKYLADVLTITAFISLGSRMKISAVLTTVVFLQIVVAVVGIWELLNPDGFGWLFNPRSYYINTRGLTDDAFWAGGSLYVSSVRAEGRLLLSWTDFHRGSSIFLEPVSLGNWTILVTILLMTFWKRLSVLARTLLIVGNIIGLCVCDGRLALVTNCILVASLPVLRFLPSALAALAPVLFAVAALGLDHFGYLTEHGDTFAGRLRFSLDVMAATTLPGALGLEPLDPAWWDAGFTYIMQSQSLPVALLLWGALMLSSIGEDAEGRRYKFGTAIFITLCLSVSYSFLSIKVVGLLWAFYGALWAQAQAQAAQAHLQWFGGLGATLERERLPQRG